MQQCQILRINQMTDFQDNLIILLIILPILIKHKILINSLETWIKIQ